MSPCQTRLPFQFGMSTLTWAPTCLAQVHLTTADGRLQTGYAADLMVPKWFEKDPQKSLEDDVDALRQSCLDAAAAADDLNGNSQSLFELWRNLYKRRMGATPAEASDRLVRGFGVALIERAAMDALCRAAGCSFFQALSKDLFGFRPGQIHPELESWSLSQSLGDTPASSIPLRHTIGLADSLRTEDLSPKQRVNDGLPETLEEDIRHYGLKYFKIKICGDFDLDLDRLRNIAAVLAAEVRGPAYFTLDGNEQFQDLGPLLELLQTLASDSTGKHFLNGLLYIEQPLSRSRSFDSDALGQIEALTTWAPVILDEADYGIESWLRGMECGYQGISVKNCKGVFRALLNRGLCEVRSAQSDIKYFQSGEDLTNLPVLALQQDLATMGAIGMPHVERNGHHYFRGLEHLPTSEAEAALREHPDLYTRTDAGIVLLVEDGQLSLRSLERPGYGYQAPIDVLARTPILEWEPVQ